MPFLFNRLSESVSINWPIIQYNELLLDWRTELREANTGPRIQSPAQLTETKLKPLLTYIYMYESQFGLQKQN